MMRVAVLSWWHVHAADYAAEALAHPGVELVTTWDEDPARGRAEAAARGIRFEPDLEALLADPAVDGVIVTSATTAHAELIPRIAAAGKHLFVEKVLAPTLAEALALADACAAAGVTLGVALSRAEHPALLVLRARIDAGALGRPTAARVRVAHDGASAGWLPERFLEPAESGGGALIDLGAHPLYLVRLLLGLPERVTATLGRVTGAAGDDNSAALFRYADGALGVAETSFVDGGAGFTIEVAGTEGGLSWRQGEDWVTATKRGAEPERIPLPPEAPTPFAQWADAIGRGERMRGNVRLALELSALAEAAARSDAEGRPVALAELAGWAELQAWGAEQ